MLNRFRQMRHVLLIALMALTLLGVQVAQSSPLHQHTQHSVDCALCHLQLSDDVLVRYQFAPAFVPSLAQAAVALTQFYSSASPSPYQGRAPPRLFS
jgi:hypothetical protein